jgi:hypothetical protein
MMAPSIQAGATPELADALLHATPAGALPAQSAELPPVTAAPAAKENGMSWLSIIGAKLGIPQQHITILEGAELFEQLLAPKIANLGHTGQTASDIIDAAISVYAQTVAAPTTTAPAPTP